MSPNVAPVRRSGSIARRNARSRAVVRTSSVSPPIFKSAEERGAGFLLEMARRWVRASSTNAILIQVNVAIGRSAEMALPRMHRMWSSVGRSERVSR